MTPTRVIGGAQAAGVGVSAFFSAGVSYVVLLLAARTLAPEDNAVFIAYWAVLFGTFGLVGGLYPEATRASHDWRPGADGHRPRTVPVAVFIGVLLCCLVGLLGFFFAGRILGEGNAWLTGVAVLAGFAYSVHLAVAGVLIARRQWRAFVTATLVESSVRLVCTVVAATVVGTLRGLAVASAVSSAAWVVLLVRPDVRAAFGARGDAALGTASMRYLQACAAGAASAALVVGFPVLLSLTSTQNEYLGAAGLLLAVSLTRAPLLLPLTAYQGVALAYFLRHRARRARALVPLTAAVLLVTALAGAAAATVGPALFTLLVGDRYTVGGAVLAGLTAAAGLLALLTLTGACSLAVGRHAAHAGGWVCATAVCVLLLLAPLPLSTRTMLSLLVAPVVGCAVHVWAILTAPLPVPVPVTPGEPTDDPGQAHGR